MKPVTRESLILEARSAMAIAIQTLAEIDAVPTALYRHFDTDGRLLYVGISLSATTRTAQHEANAPWFTKIATIKLDWFGSRSAALRAERRAIKSEKPLHNVTFNRNKKT